MPKSVLLTGSTSSPALTPTPFLSSDHGCSWRRRGWEDPLSKLLRTGVCFLQGKQKYTLPLYHAMMGGSEMARTLAKDTFAATASQLHSNVVNYVQQILAPKDS